jgi:hypothetical protein
LPTRFGFSISNTDTAANLRYYEPVTATEWQFKKILQKEFEKLQPVDFEDLIALEPFLLF